MWFVGGTYCTGGFFPDAGSLWLGFDPSHPDRGTLPSWLTASTSTAGSIDRANDWTDRIVWLNRLVRDGWTRVPGAEPETWQRPNPDGSLILEMTILSNLALDADGGRYVIEYDALSGDHSESFPIENAIWADWDQRGRLVVARDGGLFHWEPPDHLRELADFNPQIPAPEPGPPEARQWPERPGKRT